MRTGRLVPFWLLLSVLALTGRVAQAEAMLEDVSFTTLPGKAVEVQMRFDSPPADPKTYMIEKPPRLVLDLWGAGNAMKEKMLTVRSGSIDSLNFAQASDRLRVVANLTDSVKYSTRVEGNTLLLEVGSSNMRQTAQAPAARAQTSAPAPRNTSGAPEIQGVDFHRLAGDVGRITVDLSSSDIGLDIVEQGGNIVVNLLGAGLQRSAQQRLDVQDFATPVNFIDTLVKGDHATILIKTVDDPYDYMAYQSGNKLVLDFKPLTPQEQEEQKNLFPFTGEKIDLNFQNVEIRTVLQIIAEVAEKNLVVSDNVQGNITLRLKNVPWDQALDIVLKTKGLDKREAGNVLLVGTVTEIAQREAVEMQSQQQEKELAPLLTDFIQIDYRKASDIKDRIVEAKMISERGFAMADDETNTLMVRETARQIEEIRDTIKIFDVEVPQIMVQARLVTASRDFAKDIGVRWGFNDRTSNNGWSIGSGTTSPGSVDQNLQVDLGADNPVGTIALGFLSTNFALSAELSALESDGTGEIISQPKVITTNGKPAMIKSGQEIGYRVEDEGDVEVEWKDVVLSLEVTPHLIPGGKVSLDLTITEDTVGEILDTGEIAIDTNELKTSVVVSDGETVVLGGVFQETSRNEISKVPFFGDLPLIGAAFRNKVQESSKNELLIFITPQMIRESLRR
ncbi:type IV pilus secretin PilQ [Marinobacterium alkalitolerans]|uniref:type IV pilus secretin PilQ n=1 Tax=Marinobacterium alkalitolerans TaxID=1542925 RepID=UPI002E2B30CC|nr:type IV pilus secretin PilQ [Marinobacterium alkalitolerans]